MAIPLPGKALPRHDVTKGSGQADDGEHDAEAAAWPGDDGRPAVGGGGAARAVGHGGADHGAQLRGVPARDGVRAVCLGRLGPLDLAGCALAIGLTNITGHSVLFGLALPDLAAGAVLQPLRVYLRSQGITRPMAACSAIAVALHVPLNVALVFAMGLGVRGVAAAQALTNTNMLLFLLAYIRWARACEGTWKGFARPAAAASGLPALASLAVPSCVGVCLEWWWYEVVTVLAGYLPNPAAAGVLIQTTSLMYTVPMALAACVSTRASHLLKYNLMLGTFKADVKIIDDTTIRADGKPITVVSSTDPLKLPWIELGIDIVIEGTGVFVDGRRRQAHRRQRATDPPLPFDMGQLRWWA